MNLRVKYALGWVITMHLFMAFLALPELANTAWAHSPMGYQEEMKKGPHGGLVIQIGKNHVECMVNHESGYIAIYFFDRDMKAIPLPSNYSANGYLSMADGSIVWITFKTIEGETGLFLEAKTGIKEIGSFRAVISLNDGDNRENIRFRWIPAEQQNNRGEEQDGKQ